MKLTEHEKEILRNGLILQQQKVIEDRKHRAQNTFRKWTNLDEQIAITLDSKRDNIQQMLKKLDATGGSFSW